MACCPTRQASLPIAFVMKMEVNSVACTLDCVDSIDHNATAMSLPSRPQHMTMHHAAADQQLTSSCLAALVLTSSTCAITTNDFILICKQMLCAHAKSYNGHASNVWLASAISSSCIHLATMSWLDHCSRAENAQPPLFLYVPYMHSTA